MKAVNLDFRVNQALDPALKGLVFAVLMGGEVEPRREFIQSNAQELWNLDV
jgi:DNA gyrase/topoisomerase IV subunit B